MVCDHKRPISLKKWAKVISVSLGLGCQYLFLKHQQGAEIVRN